MTGAPLSDRRRRQEDAHVMADGLTYVDLIWIEKRLQRSIRFGRVASEQIIDRRCSVVAFAPGEPLRTFPQGVGPSRMLVRPSPSGVTADDILREVDALGQVQRDRELDERYPQQIRLTSDIPSPRGRHKGAIPKCSTISGGRQSAVI